MIEFIPAALPHIDVMAGIHAICFTEAWSARSMAEVLPMLGTSALIAVDGGSLRPSLAPPGPAGLVMWRCLGDEAEILTIAVLPPWRGQGLGGRLLVAAMQDAAERGAVVMFLEVAANNEVAQGLYRRHGFTPVGRRKGYYRGIDAVTMRNSLDPFKSSPSQREEARSIG